MKQYAHAQYEAFNRYGLNGLPVVDATTDIAITVRPRHMRAAEPGDPRNCAVAVAAREQFKCSVIIVNRTTAYMDIDGKVHRFSVPSSTREALLRPLDEGREPALTKSMVVTLKAPTPSNTLDARKHYNRNRANWRRNGPSTNPRTKSVVGLLRHGRGTSPTAVVTQTEEK